MCVLLSSPYPVPSICRAWSGKLGGEEIPTDLCRRGWAVHPLPPTGTNRARKPPAQRGVGGRHWRVPPAPNSPSHCLLPQLAWSSAAASGAPSFSTSSCIFCSLPWEEPLFIYLWICEKWKTQPPQLFPHLKNSGFIVFIHNIFLMSW